VVVRRKGEGSPTGSRWCRVCLWRDGSRLSGCMILTITRLQKDFFLTGEENCMLCWIVGVEVLSPLRWGMLCVLLGVYHTLMWNRILQHAGGGCCTYCCGAC
jgi:hypothetical protein